MTRPKGAKNKIQRIKKSKHYYLRVEEDLEKFLWSHEELVSYLNGLIRKDKQRAIECGEYLENEDQVINDCIE